MAGLVPTTILRAGDAALDAATTAADVATNQPKPTLVVLGTKAKHELWWVLSRTRCVKIGSASVPSAAADSAHHRDIILPS